MPSRIDVHCHYVPDFYRDALVAAGQEQPDGISALPDYSEQDLLASLDQLDIHRAYLSISSPGVHFGDDTTARTLARQVNQEGARLSQAYPERLAFFASTPLPDIDGAVTECKYALDELGAAGVVLETNFHGLYLGDGALAPLYEELDARSAIVFLHPTTPGTACGCSGNTATPLNYPRPMIEFLFDTTRSVTNMVLSGTLQRYPNIRVIVPHAGAALPIMAERIDLIGPMLSPADAPEPPSMRDALKAFHFDLAGSPVPELLTSLLSVADPARIHYGSDWPFTPTAVCEHLANKLDTTDMLSTDQHAAFMHRNSAALFG